MTKLDVYYIKLLVIVITILLFANVAIGGTSICSADLDGDGDNDILSAFGDFDNISWFENIAGLGCFNVQQIISTSTNNPQSVFSADLDNDGDLDVLSASHNDDEVAWYENVNGLGQFGIQQVISTSGNGPCSVFGIDIDGDGDNDVLSASANDNTISWYENNDGQGNFGQQNVINTELIGLRSVFSTDIDGDGDYDVLSASENDDKIAWYENVNGLGEFGPQNIISDNCAGAVAVFSIDLDGDNDFDVLSANTGYRWFDTSKVAWYENIDGLGNFGTEQIITTDVELASSVFSIDIDGDSDNDVLSASVEKIAWYENIDGLGNFGPQQIISGNEDEETAVWSIFSNDLDNDGDPDVISATYSSRMIAWYENLDGTGTFGPPDYIFYMPYHVEGEKNNANTPNQYKISSIYPNPFNPATTVTIGLPHISDLRLSTYNVIGQRIAVLADEIFSAGYHNFSLDGSHLPSGIYFVNAVVPGEMNQIRKVVLMK